ncbi:RagB/SusD family nutrient uptake outer membrane protein [Dyadobacter sp. LHD-138]|uniref:RagB/SusD family nutrient uptake outer membrane protein n=1 Tax=Dyadobacter sp. LHD-138 TaxID=3071413 RepID=UPI0027DF72F4|nr:RagB/SusD family nutrient uptake outer membrane protein [Dyadobacter sp. LHD-138]MDQ6477106.1 RagB/SusD family nutrient uptake outer membrane protein [Dyadobacter sp. LHD-138]
MKNIVKLFLVALCGSTISCQNLLEEDPQSLLSTDKFYKTAADATTAVNAISSIFHQASMFNLRYAAHTTALEDYASGQGFYIPMSQYQITTPIMAVTDGYWTGFYRAIDASNRVLKYVPAIPMDEAEKSKILGEAYFYRAFAYYNLAKNFGAVPIRTEPTENLTQTGGKREPLEKVYALVIADLKTAEQTLPATQTQTGRPTAGAAKTMLADVYLVREQWADARDKAEEVISSKKYSLVGVKTSADFEKIFGSEITTSSEEIFYIKYQHSVAGGNSIPQLYHLPTSIWATSGFGTFFGFPTYPLLRDWRGSDLRKDFNLYTSGPNKQGVTVANSATQPIRFGKFKDVNVPASAAHGIDFPIYRYAEALLIYAEAASQASQGPTPLAVERLNMVHRRAYGQEAGAASSVDFKIGDYNATTFRDLVLKERAYEFLVEGKRWYDLIRTGKAKSVIKEAKGLTISDAVLLMPIPKQEIDNNADISPEDQNPGY